MTTCHEIIQWRGSTSGAPPLTKAPLHGVCRGNICKFMFCWNSPHHMHDDVTQMCIRAQPFSTYHGKIFSDHVIFIPTWMPKRVQDLDLCNDADCELLSYGAYVYALGCHLMANLILIAFVTGNSSLEPLIEGLCAQIHVNLRWRVLAGIEPGTLRITNFLECRALHHWAMVTDESPKIL